MKSLGIYYFLPNLYSDRILNAGDIYIIPPEAEHLPRGVLDGARAIVFQVHMEGKEERILVE